MGKSINKKEQCVQTDVMQSVLKASDLRIGNKLLFLSDAVTFKNITEIREDGIFWIKTFEPKIESKNFHFKPILLNEEWLAKLGYDLISENHYGVLGHLIWKIEDRFYCDKNGMQLKYVHQLQNLYFALTGSELTVA